MTFDGNTKDMKVIECGIYDMGKNVGPMIEHSDCKYFTKFNVF